MSEQEALEPVIDPDLPIIDAHHHLWCVPESAVAATERATTAMARSIAPVQRRFPRYMFDELAAHLGSGHDVRATVAVEAHMMYRASGPEALRSVGEIEFINGVAAIAASGLFGSARLCAGIVGGVDLTLGDAVEDVLRAHIDAGGGRYRGIRCAGTAHVDDPTILGAHTRPHRLLDPAFRAGFRRLQPMGLSCDVWICEPQLPELIDLARSFPETQIILDHVGSPVGVGCYAGRLAERFPPWSENIRTLSECPNVCIKLGGLGQPIRGIDFGMRPPVASLNLAKAWRPYIETCIEAFGVRRCMFESNYPIDSSTCSYRALWNAFKRIVSGASGDEKSAVFHDTAARVYRLEIEGAGISPG
jgi:predicted TIM-barrel fold metal-dependent hydrolase